MPMDLELSTGSDSNHGRPSRSDSQLQFERDEVCGGSETKTVAVHLTGSIEPIPAVLLNSIFSL